MNANVVKLLLCLVLMSFFSLGQASAGGLSQGISRGDISDDSAINDEKKDGEKKDDDERQGADAPDDEESDNRIDNDWALEILEGFLGQF